jgi:hypothetical protein
MATYRSNLDDRRSVALEYLYHHFSTRLTSILPSFEAPIDRHTSVMYISLSFIATST